MLPQIIGEVLSVNVGLPRSVEWRGRLVSTGIFKESVAGRIRVNKLNFEGDRQADLSVHGGPDKAVYLYPAPYYDFWRGQYPQMDLKWGMFGENLTVSGPRDDEVNIGDRLGIGTTQLIVTQPRLPCYKLGIRFNTSDIIKRFARHSYTGFYVAVAQEGEIGADDKITLLDKDKNGIKVSDIVSLFKNRRAEKSQLERVIRVEALPDSWKNYFLERLEE